MADKKLQVPGSPAIKEPAEQPFQPIQVYRDENYVVLRISPIEDMNKKMQIPFSIAQIGVYGITAAEFVPRVGKENFKKAVDTLLYAMKKWLQDEKANADKLKSPIVSKPKRSTIGDALKAGDNETKQ